MVVALAEQRIALFRAARSFAEEERRALVMHLADFRVLDLKPLAPVRELRIAVEVFHGVDHPCSNPEALQLLDDFPCGESSRPRADSLIQLIFVLLTRLKRRKTAFVSPGRIAHGLAKRFPFLIREHTDHAPAILPFARIGAVRSRMAIAVAVSARHSSIDFVIQQDRAEEL